MGCKIIFNGQEYSEPAFRDLLKQKLFKEFVDTNKLDINEITQTYNNVKYEEISLNDNPFNMAEYHHLTRVLTSVFIEYKDMYLNNTVANISQSEELGLQNRFIKVIQDKLQLGNLTDSQTTLLNKAIEDLQQGKNSYLIQNVIDDLVGLWKINVNEDIINFEDIDAANLQKWDVEAGEENLKDTTSAEIKALFYRAKEINNTDTLSGFPEPLDFNNEYAHIQNLMSEALTADEMLEELANELKVHPEYQEIYNELTVKPDLLNLFYSNFSVGKTETSVTFINTVKDVDAEGKTIKKQEVKVELGNKNAFAYIQLADKWLQNINRNLEEQKVDIAAVEVEYNKLKSKLINIKNKKLEYNASEVYEEIKSLYSRLGLNFSSSKIFENLSPKTIVKGADVKYNNLQGLLDYIFDKGGLGNVIGEYKRQDREVKKYDKIVSKFKEVGNINRLARLVVKFEKRVLNSATSNVEGKMINLYHKPDFITDFFKLVNNEEKFLEFLLNEVVPDNSMQYSNWLFGFPNSNVKGLLKRTYDNKIVLNEEVYNRFSHTRLDGIKNTESSEGQKYSQLGDNDWIYELYIQYIKSSIPNISEAEKSVAFPTPIPADKSQIYFINFNRIQITKGDYTAITNYNEDFENAIKSDIFKAVWNTLYQEITRNEQAAELMFNKNEQGQYDINSMKEENTKYLIEHYHYGKDKDGNVIYTKGNTPTGRVFQFHNLRFTENGKVKSFEEVAEELGITVNGLVNLHEGRQLGLNAEQLKIMQEFVLDFINFEINKGIKIADGNKTNIENLVNGAYGFQHIAAEVTLNHYIANIEQQNFFGLQPAFYKSDDDISKRTAQIQAPGLNGNFADVNFNVLTLNDAEIKILGIDKSVNIADAQSYIRVSAFEKRVRGFGQSVLNKYPNFDIIIEKLKGKKVDNTIVYEDLTKEEREVIFQIQKNFYYNYSYDDKLKIRVPFQVKNSEAILAPQLFKGNDLQTLALLMEDLNVDQINFESAEKVGSKNKITLVDDNGNLDLKDLALDAIKQNIRSVKYQGLKQQLEVPNHILDEQNKLGTQIVRKIFDNLSNEKVYELDGKTYTGKQLKDLHDEVLSFNIIESSNKLEEELGVKNGNVDIEKLAEFLLKEAKKNGIDPNIKYLLGITNGNTNLPVDYSGVGNKYESNLLSLVTNRVINQRFPGGHAAQLSNAFFTSIKDKSTDGKGFISDFNLEAIKGINWLRGHEGKKLKYISKEGSQYAEVLLPAWTKNLFENDELIDINDERLDEKVRTMIGYRIPTEAKYSALAFKIVGFLPSNLGSTIVLPDAFVHQSGADFDIDSIYMMQYNTTYNTVTDRIEVIPYFGTDSEEDSSQRYANFVKDYQSRKVLEAIVNESTTFKWYESRIKNVFNRDILREIKSEDISKEYIDSFNEVYGIKVDNVEDLFQEIENILSSLRTIQVGLTGELLDNKITQQIYQANTRKINDDIQELIQFKKDLAIDLDYSKEDLILVRKKYNKYIANRTKKLAEVSYNEFKKLPILQQNTLEARQNRMLDVYISILTNPLHYDEIVSGSRFDDSEQSGKDLNELLRLGKTLMNPATMDAQLQYRKRNLAARDLKGITVNRDGVMSITQAIKANLKTPTKIKYDNVSKEQLEHLIATYGEENVNKVNDNDYIVNHSNIGHSPNGNVNAIGQNILDYAAQSTAHVLDSVKNPMPLNIDTFTFGIWRVPVELGATFNYSTLFISQLALRQLSSKYQLTQSITENSRNTSLEDTRMLFIRDMIRVLKIANPALAAKHNKVKFNKKAKSDFLNDVYKAVKDNNADIIGIDGVFSEGDLTQLHNNQRTKSITKPYEYLSYTLSQMKILDKWVEYKEISDAIELVNKATSADKKQVGPTFEQYDNFRNDLEKLQKDNTILSNGQNVYDAVYNNDENYKVLGVYKEYGHDKWAKIFSNLFILRSNYILRGYMDRAKVNGEVYTKKYKQHLYKLMLLQVPFFHNTDYNKLIGKVQLAKKDITFDNSDLDYEYFDNLDVFQKLLLIQSKANDFGFDKYNVLHEDNLIVDKRNDKYKIKYNNTDIGKYLIDSFSQNLKSENRYIKSISDDLIRYAYYDNGLAFGFNYSNLIPLKYLNETSGIEISRYLRSINTEGLTFNEALVNQSFATLNYLNNDIVPSVSWNTDNFFNLEEGQIQISTEYFETLDKKIQGKTYIKIYNSTLQDYKVYKRIHQDENFTSFMPVNKDKTLQDYFLAKPSDTKSEALYEEISHNNTDELLESQLDYIAMVQRTLKGELFVRPMQIESINPITKEKKGSNVKTYELKKVLDAITSKIGGQDVDWDEVGIVIEDYSTNALIERSLLEIGLYNQDKAKEIRKRLQDIKKKYNVVDEFDNLDFSKFQGDLDSEEHKEFRKEFNTFIHGANSFLDSFLHIRDLKFYNKEVAEQKLKDGIIDEEQANLNALIITLNEITADIENLKLQVNNSFASWLEFIVNEIMPEGKSISVKDAIEDASMFQYGLDALMDSHNPIAASVIKELTIQKGLAERSAEEKIKEFNIKLKEFEENGGDFDSLFHKDIGNIPSGRFASRYDISLFEKELEEQKVLLKKAKEEFDETSDEYKNAVEAWRKWSRDNVQQKYTENYYKLEDKINGEALDMYKSYFNLINDVDKDSDHLKNIRRLYDAYSTKINDLFEQEKKLPKNIKDDYNDLSVELREIYKKYSNIDTADLDESEYMSSEDYDMVHRLRKLRKETLTTKYGEKAYKELIGIKKAKLLAFRGRKQGVIKKYGKDLYLELHTILEKKKEIYDIREKEIIEKFSEDIYNDILELYKVKKTAKNPEYNPKKTQPKSNKYMYAGYDNLGSVEIKFLEYVTGLLEELTQGHRFGIVKDGYLPVLVADGRSPLAFFRDTIGLYTTTGLNKNVMFDKNGVEIKVINQEMINFANPMEQISINDYNESKFSSADEYEIAELERLFQDYGLQFATLSKAKQYQTAVKNFNNALKGQTHGENIIYDLSKVIPLYITEATSYNYKKQFEIELLNLKEFLVHSQLLKTDYKGTPIEDKVASQTLGKTVTASETSGLQSNIVKQLEWYLDNNIYDYREDEGSIAKYGRVLQNYTSLTALALNPLAATANITYGKIQLMIESVAGTHFSTKDYTEARVWYDKGATSYIADTYNKKVSTEQNAFVHYFDVMFKVMDQAERDISTRFHAEDNKWYRNLMKTNAAFFMHTAGEHLMQNQTLFSMLISHRMVGGKFLSYQQFKEGKLKKTDVSMNKEEVRKVIAENKEIEKDLKAEFEALPRIKDLFEFTEGELKLKEEYEGQVEQREFENFKIKVVGVNQKLNGIYNKEDVGAINRKILGRLVLQFKKWMRPGWNKRFGSKFGKEFYNVRREEQDKGTYVSLAQFIGKPLKGRVNSATFKDYEHFKYTMKAILRDYESLLTRGKLHWFALDEQERSRIISSFTELMYMTGFMLALSALQAMRDDDDELKDDKWFNFMLYQVDRMKTELATYTPLYGWFNEGSKLLASPAATWSTLGTALKLAKATFTYPFQDEEDRTFQSGVHSGEYKIGVYSYRLVPFMNQYKRLMNIDDLNKAYKLF